MADIATAINTEKGAKGHWLQRHETWIIIGALALLLLYLYMRSKQASTAASGQAYTTSTGGVDPNAVLQYQAAQAQASAQEAAQQEQVAGQVAQAYLGEQAAVMSAYYSTVGTVSGQYYGFQTASKQAEEQTKQITAVATAQTAQAQATANANVAAAHAAASAQTNHDIFGLASAALPFLFCDHERQGDGWAFYATPVTRSARITHPTSIARVPKQLQDAYKTAGTTRRAV